MMRRTSAGTSGSSRSRPPAGRGDRCRVSWVAHECRSQVVHLKDEDVVKALERLVKCLLTTDITNDEAEVMGLNNANELLKKAII